MLKNINNKKKGFTLTEVLVVVLIIGVISAIAYPVYTKSINKSRAVEAINLLEMVRNKQITNFARTGEYLPDFSQIGQLTADSEQEVQTDGGKILTIGGKYELAMNSATNCMSASYVPSKGKPASFTFSSSYETSGLGCDGDICKTFGNIVGGASSVCNCGTTKCNSPLVLNQKTCSCECLLACSEGGCHAKNQAKTETRACGNGGTQTRYCPESCDACNASWGPCTGQSCEGDSSAICNNCGTKTRVCNNTTGQWGPWSGCVGSKTDTSPCPSGYTGSQSRTCTNDVWGEWNTAGCTKNPIECSGEATAACENCGTKTRTCDKTTGTWSAYGACVGTKTETALCDEGYTGDKTRTCTDNVWAAWNTSACVKKETDCNPDTKPEVKKTCGNCGICTREVNCDTATGKWEATDWSNPAGEGECTPAATKLIHCGNLTGYTQGVETRLYKESTCSSSCSWSTVAPCNSCREHPNCGKNFGNGLTGPCYCASDSTVELEKCSWSKPEEGVAAMTEAELSGLIRATRDTECNYGDEGKSGYEFIKYENGYMMVILGMTCECN